MTVFKALIHAHLNYDTVPYRTVSIYTGPDDDNLSFTGHLTMSEREAETLQDVLDSYSGRFVSSRSEVA